MYVRVVRGPLTQTLWQGRVINNAAVISKVGWDVMVRSRRTKIPAEEKTRLVLAVLAGEMTGAEAARRCGVSSTQVTKWKHQFLEAGSERMQEVPSGAPRGAGDPEQRRL